MPKPTFDQLEKINAKSIRPLSEDEVYVFETMMIDDQVTAYYSKIHENLLRKFAEDAKNGVALIVGHDTSKLPVGKSFDARLEESVQDGKAIKSVYGNFYIPRGVNTQIGMSTDDIIQAIESGVVSSTSIGFTANKWECSICGRDIRSDQCHHIPGKEYTFERDGQPVTEQCVVVVGSDGNGELLENSLVFLGAVKRAKIGNYDVEDVNNLDERTNLIEANNIKDIPENSTVYQVFSHGGLKFYFKMPIQGSEQSVEELKEKADETVEVTVEATAEVEQEKEDFSIEGAFALLKQKDARIEKLQKELIAANEELMQKEFAISELKKQVEELKQKADLVEEYKRDLIEETIKEGIRAYGNAFPASSFEAFLGTLSIEDIKKIKGEFTKEFEAKFEGVRVTEPKAEENKELDRGDFEDEAEFRAFVAEKAAEYAKEKGISIAEATKIVYKKLLKGE